MTESALPPQNPPTIEDRLELLQQSLGVQVPYTAGVLPAKTEDLILYYDVEGEDFPRCVIELV